MKLESFVAQLQEYKRRLEEKDLVAVLELAAEGHDDGKVKKIGPLVGVVRDEEVVGDLVFYALCTAIDVGFEYCTRANVKIKALKVRILLFFLNEE